MDISVVMATCNGEKYLEQQILSILNQTLKPVEIIVCDDRSTDNTLAILEKYQQQQCLKYVINSHRLGVIENFKKGVNLASSSNYVALCDQDDQWYPEKLEKSAFLLKKIDDPLIPCMVYTDLLIVDESERILNTSFRSELGQDKYKHNLQTLIFSNFINGCTILMNPNLSHQFIDMPDNVSLNHDGWLALLAFTFGKAESVNESLVRYRKHSNNVSIDANFEQRNRYLSTIKQLVKAIKGNDNFLSDQFETVKKFCNKYAAIMPVEKKIYYDKFLKLESQPYIIKKLAFGRVVRKFKV